MRSILVFADHADPATETRLETALSLARSSGGHVSVLVDTPIARFMAMDAMGGSYLAADAIRDAVERDDAYAEALAERLKREDVPFDIQRGEDEPVDALADASRLADVIVLSRGCLFAGQLAVSARAPILVVPETGVVGVPFTRAAVAWDGSQEAAAAMKAALPLLAAAGQADVLIVSAEAAGYPAVDAVQYLSRHGVHAELHDLARAGSTEGTLAAEVHKIGADLLVMGAYGHSRFREFIVGGVSRAFLESEGGPTLLLAH
ncbi:MAG TPA: universal stress protein [Novosphingobium sp.]|nr:universal stress protein [Novosphingobium sp.]